MKRILYLVAPLLWGCSPEKAQETLATTTPAADTAALDQVVDSVSNTRIDGTATTTLPLDVKQQLPAELEVHLDRTHGLWQLPALTSGDLARIPQEEQGPYFIEADFNGDQKQDYAIQLQERDSVFVYVFLKNSADDFQEHLLTRDQLYQLEGKKRSIQYLTLAKKSDRYYDYATRQKDIVLPQDGISVGAENYTATYVWEKGKFRRYETGD
ncbi:hypothetical protein ACFSC6_13255 [Rufibacter sediminis]|uniref:Lipoprotein n=1 Tax=Rufibacter sediminis TaxID=2762756 RepID=A0ABR6VY64_9BACT|nr:hypothetical protein [Rufibacter sediminis]MBC3542163.1 hypothetical protein [Rufibacter sediminis]